MSVQLDLFGSMEEIYYVNIPCKVGSVIVPCGSRILEFFRGGVALEVKATFFIFPKNLLLPSGTEYKKLTVCVLTLLLLDPVAKSKTCQRQPMTRNSFQSEHNGK